MAKALKGFVLDDGTVIGADTLTCLQASYNDDGTFKNFQLVTEEGHKINVEAGDNIAFKPMGKIQFDTNHYADDGDKDEFEMATICDKKTKVEGVKWELAGLKFITGAADTARGWAKDTFKMMFKKETGDTDVYAKLNLHAASIDIRARSTGDGTGGGIALQIAGRDSAGKTNKLKVETDQTVDVEFDDVAGHHTGEGGKGIEIGTFNPKMFSAYARDYRFKRSAKVYAVKRGTPVLTGEKTDYPTQADDSKDIKDANLCVTWDEIIRGIQYLKAQGYITATPENQSDIV